TCLPSPYGSTSPTPPKNLKEWFVSEFQGEIAQATISEFLPEKYGHLNTKPVVATCMPFKMREQAPKWPELDQALAMWQKEKKVHIPITGDLIKRQEIRFWNRFACYQVTIGLVALIRGMELSHDFSIAKMEA
ncbi:hypothetical protein Golomagni_04355, partial [Golovinomyces magnicellulatus]